MHSTYYLADARVCTRTHITHCAPRQVENLVWAPIQTGIVLEDPASWGATVVEGINPEGEHWDKE